MHVVFRPNWCMFQVSSTVLDSPVSMYQSWSYHNSGTDLYHGAGGQGWSSQTQTCWSTPELHQKHSWPSPITGSNSLGT